jgi:hypothetical protein
LIAGCYQPPTYVVPTEVPTPTPVRATAVAALQSGPTATQVAVVAATTVAASPMRIVNVSLDPENAANSAVSVLNIGGAVVDLSGWTLLVQNYRVELPTTQYMSVSPGSTMIVHMSSSNTPTSGQNVYVGLGAMQSTPRVDGDRTVLLDPKGQVASVYPPE